MRPFLSCLLSFITAMASLPAAAQKLVPFQFPREGIAPSLCAFQTPVPRDALVLAAGEYGGRKTGFQIDDSGHEATQIDVAVNSGHNSVVLMLGAYEPTVWNVGWSAGTRIVAVIVSGYHAQAVAGLPRNVPIINNSYANRSSCGYFYIQPTEQQGLDAMAMQVLGRPVDKIYRSSNGKVVVGDTLEKTTHLLTSKDVTVESLRQKNAPPTGPAGLAKAVRNGILRAATADDLAAWETAMQKKLNGEPPLRDAASEGRRNRMGNHMDKTYVVLKRFTLPAGLYGGDAAVFLLPRGVAVPTGNLGHSALLDLNTMSCKGGLCLGLGLGTMAMPSLEKARDAQSVALPEQGKAK
ncbi:hypothetical protein [Massilia sp. DWR3-1-1]|uniref:hypothetical protein n=1 Tax=Massilia sp. DWR3-1-1 TaxID=2804559 RepID=UPI003CEC0267